MRMVSLTAPPSIFRLRDSYFRISFTFAATAGSELFLRFGCEMQIIYSIG